MSKKLKLPRGYAAIIRERLKNQYSIGFIRQVKTGERSNMEIKKALLELSAEHVKEIKNLQDMEEELDKS